MLDDHCDAGDDEDDHSDNDDRTAASQGKMEDIEAKESNVEHSTQATSNFPHSPGRAAPDSRPLEVNPGDVFCAGFNGRCNKPADTCYSFWVGGALCVSTPKKPLRIPCSHDAGT